MCIENVSHKERYVLSAANLFQREVRGISLSIRALYKHHR